LHGRIDAPYLPCDDRNLNAQELNEALERINEVVSSYLSLEERPA